MGWLDWEGGFHHGHEDFDPDFDPEEELEAERAKQRREELEAEDRSENQRRRYPLNCGFCGEPLATIDFEHHHDWEQGFSPHEYGHYSCGTDIDDMTQTFSHGGETARWLTFEERAFSDSHTDQWGFRVPRWRLEDYKLSPEGFAGQSAACRRLMELRWKEDPEALERDRADTRTDRERMSVEDERELVKAEKEAQRIELIRGLVARMTTTDTWTDAHGVTQSIDQLTLGHLQNIRTWLDRSAPHFQKLCRQLYWHDRDRTCEDIHGEPVDIGIPSEVHNRMENDLFRDPLEWVRDQPVYEAVTAAIRKAAPEDRRRSGYVASVSPTPPPAPTTRPEV